MHDFIVMVEYTSGCVQPAKVLGIVYDELKGKGMTVIQGCESKPSSLDFDRSIISWQYSMLQKNGSTVPKFDIIFMDQIISTELYVSSARMMIARLRQKTTKGNLTFQT
jgi:hypothetical protein